MTEIIPYLFYRDVPAALAFLARAYGFSEEMRTATPTGGMHAQMTLDGQRIMMGHPAPGHSPFAPPAVAGTPTVGVFVYVGDVDAHYARAVAAGAEIEQAPHDVDYGRTYTSRDLDGHPWFFTQALSGREP